jgi:hypothetical protein
MKRKPERRSKPIYEAPIYEAPLHTDCLLIRRLGKTLVCFQCKKPLDKNDPKSVHVAIDADACERYGITESLRSIRRAVGVCRSLDLSSEIREEHSVVAFLCDVCGTRAQALSVQQIRETDEDKPTVQ